MGNKRVLFSKVALLVLLLVLTGCRKVGGVITDKATGLPLPGVFVMMKTGDQLVDTLSNNKGSWAIGKKSTVLGQYTAYKFGFEPFTFEITAETKKDFWMKPNPQETVRLVMQLTKKALSEDNYDLLNEVYNYLAIKDRAALQLPTFKQEVKKQQTFYAMIDDSFSVKEPSKVDHDSLASLLQPVDLVSEQRNVVIKTPIFLDTWSNATHRSIYTNVAKVPVELKKSTGGTVQLEFYLVQADEFWHYFWFTIS